MSEEKKLTLHDHHSVNGAKFTSFAGWKMPVSYGSSLNEHLSVRESAGLFDVSHMGEIEVVGPEAEDFLNYALTNDLRKCSVGQAQYSILCNEDGGTIDDLIVYRRGVSKYFLCVNASNVGADFEILSERVASFNCELTDLSTSFAQLALQGPSSETILSGIISDDLSQLLKMHFIEGEWMGGPSILSRTGYTGEDGFEIYCSINEISSWVDAFEKTNVPWIGLAARDSLRLEAGFPLYGHELSEKISPVQAGLSWAIGWGKDRFCGKKALVKEKEGQLHDQLIYYLASDQRIPREGCPILDPSNNQSGVVLSGGFSPLHKKPMGTALIRNSKDNRYRDSGWNALLRGKKIPIDIGLPALRRTT